MKKNISLFILSLFILLACEKNSSNAEIPENDELKSNHQIDTSITAIMRYIAGLPTEQYAELQQDAYYKTQVQEIDKTWQKINEKSIEPIKNWVNENEITDRNDTIPLFYPFSGPDFFYANYFFPYAKTYIMFGLENPGSLPDFNSIDKPMLKKYREDMMTSMSEINALGFFATKKMAVNFKDKNLDGSLHLILFYLGRSGHDIVSFSKIYIDQFGNVQKINEPTTYKSKTQGIKIEFVEKSTNTLKTLYYVQVDISDNNLKNNTEFLHFINQFGEKNTFIKSASYLLHKNEYSLIRTNILSQSRKILQDDTGIPFQTVDNKNYELSLFGKYTGTIALFSSRFQPNLKLAYDKKGNSKDLPFQLGYNVSHGESLLMLIKTPLKAPMNENIKDLVVQNKAVPNEIVQKTIVYKVQIKSSKIELVNYKTEYGDFPDVGYYRHNGLIKYTIGEKSSRADCEELLALAKNKGFKDAFIIAFVNGQRIALEDIGGGI